ncbi:MAG: DUF262 domain-containing protein [Bacteroidaceae bacterium]|nr:DUF262 domain-containing protein [Bacteroidaceae bacterium]
MDELIYSTRQIFTEYLKMEGCDFFNIPEYQRGYKWTVDNIIQLLEDLKGFKQNSSDEFYCLQNITITKTNINGHSCFNVIDGQQRLTTLFILISYIQRNMSNKVLSAESNILRYSIREETDKFLRESILTGDYWNDVEYKPATKDQYYIAEVAKAVAEWFNINNLEERTILDHLKLIVNKVESGEEETVFASLNGGKVDLDGADLVRAILITRAAKQKYPSLISEKTLHQIANNDINLNINIKVSSLGKINEFRVKLGIELDMMNNWWSDRKVRSYFEQLLPNRISQNKSFKYSEYPIDLLYYAFFEAYKDKLATHGNTDLDLRIFENGIDKDGEGGNDHLEFYKEVKEFHLTLVDWYNDDEIYNLLGYLMYNYKSASVSFAMLWNEWKLTESKSDFKSKLKRIIREQLALAFAGSDDSTDIADKLILLRKSITNIAENWYVKDFIIRFLPLLDLIPEKKTVGNSVRTIFKRLNPDYFKCNQEDKEHVRSQTRQIAEENMTEEDRLALEEENRQGINSIGNIVLLKASINRSYGNVELVKKMDRIAREHIMNDTYIRPHTLNVFLSKLQTLKDNGISEDSVFWSEEDIVKTVKAIDSSLTDYLELPKELITTNTEEA